MSGRASVLEDVTTDVRLKFKITEMRQTYAMTCIGCDHRTDSQSRVEGK